MDSIYMVKNLDSNAVHRVISRKGKRRAKAAAKRKRIRTAILFLAGFVTGSGFALAAFRFWM